MYLVVEQHTLETEMHALTHTCTHCDSLLATVAILLLQDLKTTVNLSDEMRQVTEQNAKQVSPGINQKGVSCANNQCTHACSVQMNLHIMQSLVSSPGLLL